VRRQQAGQDPDHGALEQAVLLRGSFDGRRIAEGGREVRIVAGGRDL
jgi:hypothetical protein